MKAKSYKGKRKPFTRKRKPTDKTSLPVRYKTFNERLSNLSIDVVHRVGKVPEVPEDADTFFYEGYEKWINLNCTLHFETFKEEINKQFQSFAQLLHNKSLILSVLKKHLQIKDSLALQPLLDLVVQLARDLQYDFYPEFPDFFKIIVKILNINNPDILEWAFTALSCLFKFLWRYMIKDIQNVFSLYSRLLSDGQKLHIRVFAAESFSFLMRKVRDKENLFVFLFLQLESNPNLISGIGQLLFETVKGVPEQFHSCLEMVFPIVLKKLKNPMEDEPQWDVELVLKCLEQMNNRMINHCSKKFCAQIWDILFTHVYSAYNDCIQQDSNESTVEAAEYLHRLLEIFSLWFYYKNGALITNVDSIVNGICTLLKHADWTDELSSHLLTMASFLLQLEKPQCSVEKITKIKESIFESNYDNSFVYSFCQSLFDWELFEKDILPQLLLCCQHSMLKEDPAIDTESLNILCELVMHKKPLPSSAVEYTWEQYLLNFAPAVQKFCKRFPDKSFPSFVLSLLNYNSEDFLSNLETLSNICASLTIVLHMEPCKKPVICRKVKKLFSYLISLLEVDSMCKDNLYFLFYQTQFVIIRLLTPDAFFEFFPLKCVEKLIVDNPENVHVLRIADFYFTHASSFHHKHFLSETILQKLLCSLRDNFSSPYPEIRLLTSHMLSLFDIVLPELQEKHINQIGIFKMCLKVELVGISFHTYKTRLLYLENLSYDLIQNNLPIGPYEDISLRYIISHLYMNFQLFWQPALNLIASYARGMKLNAFWSIFGQQLLKVDDAIEVYKQTKLDLQMSNDMIHDTDSCENIFSKQLELLTLQHQRIDLYNFRILLWKALDIFPEVAEAKHRDVVPLLLKFIRNDFFSVYGELASTQNLEKHSEDSCEILNLSRLDMEENKDEYINNSTEPINKKRKIFRTVKTFKGFVGKSLTIYLTVFSKFRQPQNIIEESELKKIYLEFLTCGNENIQLLAFQCLLPYKIKGLKMYKENIERIINGKTFRSELVRFNINQEEQILKDEDRPTVMPIIMRLLLGKMFTKPIRKSSKCNNFTRKSTILNFLAGCPKFELNMFMDMIFGSFEDYFSCDIFSSIRNLLQDLNIKAIPPLNKMQSLLGTLNVVFISLGNFLDDYLTKLLHIVLCFLATSIYIYNIKDNLYAFYQKRVKIIRKMCLERITQFFELFNRYNFSENEIEAIFETAVWPQISTLSIDSVDSPSALLKLFLCWSENPRYFCLLAKHCSNDTETTPLAAIFSLLNAPHIKKIVVNMVITIINNLLTLNDFESKEVKVISTTNTLSPVLIGSLKSKEAPNYGTLLLINYIPNILFYFTKKISQKSGLHSLPDNSLYILSQLSEFVTQPQESDSLVRLMIPFLHRKFKISQEMEEKILSIISNLIKWVPNPEKVVRSISRLFYKLEWGPSRSAISNILKVVGESTNNDNIKLIADIAAQLNAWNLKKLDEPDYHLRLEAFRRITEIIKNMEEIDEDFLFLIIYNCFYFIIKSNDLALKDNSLFILQLMIEKLSEEAFKETAIFHSIVIDVLLAEIKNKLTDKNDMLRNEFITLWAAIVRSYPDHPLLKEMVPLTDSNVDVDFFENIKHIQMVRRGKALHRIVWLCEKNLLSLNVLMTYIMPLVKTFLLNPEYNKQNLNFLVENAVDCIGVISERLPWNQYRSLLLENLSLLQTEKQYKKLMIRLIKKILEAFHFDLSHSTYLIIGETDNKQMDSVDKIGLEVGDMTNKISDENCNNSEELMQNDSPVSLGQVDCFDSLSAKEATGIHIDILTNILPKLYNCLLKKRQIDDAHKVNRKYYAEDEHIIRIPIAFAMINLLKRLPKGTLEYNLPNILLKVCHKLKSHSISIRDKIRSVLVDIIKILGPTFFPYIVQELKSILKEGYQLHVLLYTVHSLLKGIESLLKPGSLDSCIGLITFFCKDELIGRVAEEKEVEKIVRKIFEARKIKSYNIYRIVAQYVTEMSLPLLVKPLKQTLQTTHSFKIAVKIQTAFQCIQEGLSQNKYLSEKFLLIFIHGIISDDLPILTESKSKSDIDKESKSRRPDCFLITPEPKRSGPKPAINKKSNLHIYVNFGLQLLLYLIKNRLTTKEHLEMLDPYVNILTNLLDSKFIRIIITTVHCLGKILKMPLPSVNKNIIRISNSLFLLLRNYSKIGSGSDNLELLKACFKTVTVLVKDIKYHVIEEDHLKILLSFVEQDLHDYMRQSTAFILLHAIISRKLVCPEVFETMLKVQEMCVTSEIKTVREKCHSVLMKFFLDYPIGEKIKSSLEFFVAQLNYKVESGRLAALEVLMSIYSSFPHCHLEKYACMFFVPMAICVINDESATCRETNSKAIKVLLLKLPNDSRDVLFTISLQWFQDNKLLHRRLGAHLCGLFVDVEDFKFERHLDKVFVILEAQLEPGRYAEKVNDCDERQLDHHLFACLNLIIKLLTTCHIIRNKKWEQVMNNIWECLKDHLLHPHEWVRLSVSQCFGLLFAAWSPNDLFKVMNKKSKTGNFLLDNLLSRLLQLTHLFFMQLGHPDVKADLATQITKNLVFIAKIVHHVNPDDPKYLTNAFIKQCLHTRQQNISLMWMVKKLCHLAINESISNPRITCKRYAIFGWLAAIASELGPEKLPNYLEVMIKPLFRELNTMLDKNIEQFIMMVQEVQNHMKKIVGVEVFSQYYTKVQMAFSSKKLNRKSKLSSEAVTNPVQFALRKIRKHEIQKLNLKRKKQDLSFKSAKKLKN